MDPFAKWKPWFGLTSLPGMSMYNVHGRWVMKLLKTFQTFLSSDFLVISGGQFLFSIHGKPRLETASLVDNRVEQKKS
jgi:hypothetical protein